jgi:hypothetical protein
MVSILMMLLIISSMLPISINALINTTFNKYDPPYVTRLWGKDNNY